MLKIQSAMVFDFVFNDEKPFLQSLIFQEKLRKEIFSVLLITMSLVWVLKTGGNIFRLKSLMTDLFLYKSQPSNRLLFTAGCTHRRLHLTEYRSRDFMVYSQI